ncbi:hypothetical protein [Leucothrix arctica]|uniref:Uncharacterized protein n=1 Tax=Leucothrix arctica TaxID=1481894 RepID=A0A317CH84_9GAMM|nr:hypothetical protein [Leucothrix arctica]PWQ97916.1 hypothetical protein DKT75_05480 [Leucothrix arctica]
MAYKLFFTFFILLILSPLQANSLILNECYEKNIYKGNILNDVKDYSGAVVFYKNAYQCAKERKQKISSLASLSAAEFSKGNKDLSKNYLLILLDLSPNNKWAEKFASDKNISLVESKADDELISENSGGIYFKRNKETALLDLPQSIYVKGVISKDMLINLKKTISSNNIKSAIVYFDSPGGDLLAGMGIGRLIRNYGFSTGISVNASVSEYRESSCFSACVLAYSGGVYRSLSSGGRVGVHRFSKELSSKNDLDLAQVVSAKIIKYLLDMGIDVQLFDRMSNTSKDSIDIISKKDASILKLVNSNGEQKSWTIESLKGKGILYLKGVQRTWRGVGKLLFTCDSKDLIYATAMYSKGNIIPSGEFILEIDNKKFDIDGEIMTDKDNYIVIFKPSIEQYKLISRGSKVSFSILALNPDFFYGFSLAVNKENSLVSDYMGRCIRLSDK